jgi:hypothetical protein
MTRDELYALVWDRPVTKVAADFGISDVALRKICKKHDIPTPPIGYWARLSHGKQTTKIPLPTQKTGTSISIVVNRRRKMELPEEIKALQSEARVRAALGDFNVNAPDHSPKQWSRYAAVTRRALREAVPDHCGFVSCKGTGISEVKVSRKSLDRAIRILHGFLEAVEIRGYELKPVDPGLMLVVKGLSFGFGLHETTDRLAREPSKADIKAQADYDQRSKKMPNLYPPGKRVWEAWEQVPSGRLVLKIWDPTASYWNPERTIGHWYDRRSKKLEAFLVDAIVAMEVAVPAINGRLAAEAEAERLRNHAEQRRRKLEARRLRAERQLEYVLKKSDELAQLQRVLALKQHFDGVGVRPGNDQIAQMATVIGSVVATLSSNFEAEEIEAEIERLDLLNRDEPENL